MNKINDGGQAFPRLDAITNTGAARSTPGMTLRDWFAGQALTGMLSSETDDSTYYVELAADRAYRFADAMLAARADLASAGQPS